MLHGLAEKQVLELREREYADWGSNHALNQLLVGLDVVKVEADVVMSELKAQIDAIHLKVDEDVEHFDAADFPRAHDFDEGISVHQRVDRRREKHLLNLGH